MWLTGTIGIFQYVLNAFAKLIPTQSAGSSPGPTVTAITSISGFFISEILFIKFSKRYSSLSSIFCILFISLVDSLLLVGNILCNFASLSDFSKTLIIFFPCSLLAIIGNTPPYCVWSAICEETSFPSILNFIFLPSLFASIIDIAVSSQEVSIAKILIKILYHKGFYLTIIYDRIKK